jgi:hypothetical protein
VQIERMIVERMISECYLDFYMAWLSNILLNQECVYAKCAAASY